MMDSRKAKLASLARSSWTAGAANLFEMAWSIPKESRRPSWRTAAVRRLVPEKTSIAKKSVHSLPLHLADSLASKDANAVGGGGSSWRQDAICWSKLWGLLQPGSAQT